MDFAQLARLCRAYADACIACDALADDIEDRRRRIERQKMRAIRACVARKAAARNNLAAALAGAPHLFARPRTRLVEGVKIGFRKQPGRVEADDETRAIQRVRARLPEKAASLVKIRETLDKQALRKLTGRELAAIGVTLTDDTDMPVIDIPQSAASKHMEALADDADSPDPAKGGE